MFVEEAVDFCDVKIGNDLPKFIDTDIEPIQFLVDGAFLFVPFLIWHIRMIFRGCSEFTRRALNDPFSVGFHLVSGRSHERIEQSGRTQYPPAHFHRAEQRDHIRYTGAPGRTDQGDAEEGKQIPCL